MFRKKQTPVTTRQRADKTNTIAAFSYHARRSDQVNPAQERQSAMAASGSRHSKRLTLRTFIVASAVAMLVLVGLYNTTLSSQPTVVVEPSNHAQTILRDTTEYSRAAQELLGRSILDQNKVTVTTAAVSRSLLEQFPELESAQLVLPFFGRTPVLHLRASEPVLLVAASNGTFALSGSGTALVTGARLSQLSGLNLPLVTDESGIPIKLHEQALTSQDVNFIRNVVTQVTAKGLTVASLVIPTGKSQLDLRLNGQPYYVKFNLASKNATQQAGSFLALIERLREQGIAPAEYIDVRVDGRAYYK